MREFFLSPEPRSLRPWFKMELEVLSIYPEDTDSLRQALLLLRDENVRFEQSNGEDYRPSNLTKTLLEALSKSYAQRLTTGYVAVALIGLLHSGDRPSLRRAANVVAEFGAERGDIAIIQKSDGKLRPLSKPISSDVKTIEGIWRKYRGAAHIYGAIVATSDHLELRAENVRTLSADACFLTTVMLFQQELAKLPNFEKWNLWHIRADPPFEYSDYPALIPEFGSIKALFDPWVRAGQPQST